MNNTALQLQQLEANLERLRARIPDLPTTCVLLSRVLQHLGRGMSGMLEHEIRPFGLTEAEFRVLVTLFSQPEGVANPTDLCTKTSQRPANMSRICDALVGRQLITRVSSVHDRRKMVLQITEKGEELVQQLMPLLCGPLHDMFEEFSDQEQQQLLAQLKRLISKLDQASRHPVSEHPE